MDPSKIVDYLLDKESVNCVLTNDYKSVEAYRAKAANKNYSRAQPRDNITPSYYSNLSIPSQIKTSTCTVTIDPVFKTAQKTLDVETDENSTVQTVVNEIIQKTNLKESPNKVTLKLKNAKEYIKPTGKIWNSALVRENIRRKSQIALTLLPLKTETASAQHKKVAVELANNYRRNSSCDAHRKVLKKKDFKINYFGTKNYNDYDYIPFEELYFPFSVDILGVDNLTKKTISNVKSSWNNNLCVKTFLFFGDTIVKETVSKTSYKKLKNGVSVLYGESIGFDKNGIKYNRLPRTTKIAFFLCSLKPSSKKEIVAWTVQNLIDEYGCLVSGALRLRLWPRTDEHKDKSFIFTATTSDNTTLNPNVPVLGVRFEEFQLPVIASKVIDYERERAKAKPIQRLQSSLQPNPSKTDFEALPLFLQSVNWVEPLSVVKARRLLRQWQKPADKRSAIALLDFRFHDTVVRNYAVDELSKFDDEELRIYLIQIVQILKFEPYHDSALSRLILKRAIRNPARIGHYLFWNLKTEINNEYFSQRYYLIMEEYLHNAGMHFVELVKQQMLVEKLTEVAKGISSFDKESMEEYQNTMTRLNEDFFGNLQEKKVQMILDPRLESSKIISSKCRFMDSKKKPLWLVFQEIDCEFENYSIFKRGDDLRQDALTLQLLKVMDQIWLSEGLDLRLLPYDVIATGKEIGMIEVVVNAETVSKIQIKYGGGAVGALREYTIDNFLRAKNPDSKDYELAKENFVSSCAGYCVATYALGIADRHNSNIMLTHNGVLFHIDFGHFLGNFKTKMGVLRERSPFVFTSEMAFVMGGKRHRTHPLFLEFKSLCGKAFLVLRRHYQLFVDMLKLMVPAGLPELRSEKDIDYFRNMLLLDQSEKEASESIQKTIHEALGTTSRQFDNLIHNIKHR